jgi:Flp pilus assembly protein TadG
MTKSWKQKLKQYCWNTKGNTAVLFAASIPLVLSAVGAGVDFTRYLVAQSKVEQAADRAALAAVSVDGQEREDVVNRFFKLNSAEGVGRNIKILDLDVVTGNAKEHNEVSVEVQVSAQIEPVFLKLVGMKTMNISHLAKASRNVRSVEVVITAPSNGTMCSKKHRTPNTNSAIPGDTLISLTPDRSCTHFNSMKAGAKKFIDLMKGNEALQNVKIGIVPYNYKVRMPSLRNIPPTLLRNEPSNFYSNVSDAEPLSPIVSLTPDLNKAKAAINGLRQSSQGVAWARTNLATHVAGLMLDPNQSQYFSGVKPSEFGDPSTEKVVILMSDGINSGCCFTNWRLGNFSNQYVYFYEPDNDEQIQICTALKDSGVRIFSILFDVDERDEGGAQINNIFARCASGAYSETGVNETSSNTLLKCRHKQNCYNAANDDELIKTYADIAKTFFIPTLSK